MLRRTEDEDNERLRQAICYVLEDYRYAYEKTIHHLLFYLDYNERLDCDSPPFDVVWERNPTGGVYSPDVHDALTELADDGLSAKKRRRNGVKRRVFYGLTVPEDTEAFRTAYRDQIKGEAVNVDTETLVEWAENRTEYESADFDEPILTGE